MEWLDRYGAIMDLLVFSFLSFLFCAENGFSVEGKGDALYLKSTQK